MTSNPRSGSTRRSIAFLSVALVAVFAVSLGTGLLAPRAADAQRSSSSDRRGFLGVSLQDLDEDLRDSYDFRGSGVLVSDVTEGSPADRVGIEEGDILTKLDDVTMRSQDQATDYIRGLSPGTLVEITVVRDGETRRLGRAELTDLRGASRWEERIAPPAPRSPRAPRAPRTPRVAPSPRVAPTPGARMFRFEGGRGRLGVETHDLDGDLGSYFHSPNGDGVLILRVVEDTPADRAGLKAGDVIRSVGGKDVDDTEELRRALRDRDEGDVDLRILRNGNQRTITARLDERQSFDLEGLPGNGDWMSLFDHDRDGDDDGKRVRVFGNLDHLKHLDGLDFDIDDMSPEERARFDEDMEKLREDLRELRRELREMRGNRR
jgi:membrane-associated protease RseP (regulator of RpoE activity)